jgi:hypothetical protein
VNTLEFPPETPDELRLESDRRLAISVVAILLCVNLVFVIINLRDSGPNAASIPPVVIVRLIGVFVAAVVVAFLCAAKTQRQLEKVSFGGSLAVVILLLIIQALVSATDIPSVAFDLVFVNTLFIALPSRPSLQAIPVTILCAGAAFMLWVRPGSGLDDGGKLRFVIFFAAAIALGYVASVRRFELWSDLIRARQAEWESAIEADRAKCELQTLRGIIPICSHCNRVRIEDGRLWEAVDMYVSRRTDAAFSHGVCPDCLAVHYPNVRAE